LPALGTLTDVVLDDVVHVPALDRHDGSEDLRRARRVHVSVGLALEEGFAGARVEHDR
jgi:hypothetical protein